MESSREVHCQYICTAMKYYKLFKKDGYKTRLKFQFPRTLIVTGEKTTEDRGR